MMVNKMIISILIIAIFTLAQSTSVNLWYSSAYRTDDYGWFKNPSWNNLIKYKMAPQPNRQLKSLSERSPSPNQIKININEYDQFQTITGIGASFQHTSIANLNRMSPQKRAEVLQAFLNNQKGIGMNYMRICFGSPDFTAWPYYTYDDNGPDPLLQNFSIQKDIDNGIIKLLKQALSYNPRLKIMASPWNPPGWMKTNGKIGFGGYLKPEYFEVAAKYYRMAIQAYVKEGIPIYSFTLQNQPGFGPDYPSMMMTSQDQIRLALLLADQFEKNHIRTGIYILDHNFNMAVNQTEIPCAKTILQNAEVRSRIMGTAFHDYVGDPSSGSELHDIFPEKDIMLSEKSMAGVQGMARIMDYFHNWCTAFLSWVIMLDQNRQPNIGGNPIGVTFSILSADKKSYWMNADFYLLGLFTKFVVPGSTRIYSKASQTGSYNQIAFLTPDNNIVFLIVNYSESPINFSVNINNKGFSDTIGPNVFAVYKWDTLSKTLTNEQAKQIVKQ